MTGRISEYPGDADAPISDPKDRHVHAAAVAGEISCLVTSDSDFTRLTPAVMDLLPYEIHTPDSFFVSIDRRSPMSVLVVTREQHAYWTFRGRSDLPDALRRAGCPHFADRVTGHLRTLRT
ncbi:MAG: hypothetical protein WKF57_01345 [Nakamurella sp.]